MDKNERDCLLQNNFERPLRKLPDDDLVATIVADQIYSCSAIAGYQSSTTSVQNNSIKDPALK
jgi:hypothetical protein